LDKEHLGVDSVFAFGVSESLVCEPCFTLVTLHNGVTNVLLGNGVSALGWTVNLTGGALHDGGMDLLVKTFEGIFTDDL